MMKRMDFGDEPISEDNFRRAFLIRIPGREDVYLSPKNCELKEITVENPAAAEGSTAAGDTTAIPAPQPAPGDTMLFGTSYSCTFDFHENFGDLDQALLFPEQHCQILKQLMAATEDPNSENLSLLFLNLVIAQIKANHLGLPGFYKLYPDPEDFPDTFEISVPDSWELWYAMAPNNASKWAFDWDLTIEKGAKGYRIKSPFSEIQADETREQFRKAILDNYRYVLRNCPP